MLLTNLVVKNYSTQLVRLKHFLSGCSFEFLWSFFSGKLKTFPECERIYDDFRTALIDKNLLLSLWSLVQYARGFLNRLACKKCNSGEEGNNKFMKDIITD